MRARRRSALPVWSAFILGSIAAWSAASARAQAPAAADAIFRAGTQEVLVDAIVTDKKGNFERGLTRQDFKILEDGKEQPITSFALESADSQRFTTHFIALVFELEDPGLREQVTQFVDRFASPHLYMCVFSRINGQMRLQQAFTTDTARIKAAIRAMQIVPPMPTQQELSGREPGEGNPTLNRISSVAAAIASVRGRKALIWFTHGMYGFFGVGGEFMRNHPPPIVGDLQKAIDDCNAADVSIYSFIRGRGLPPDYGDGYYAPPDFVRDLAEGTDGKYAPPGAYDLASYLGSTFAAQNDYYQLGYAPAAESADKPCHKLKVKVAGSGLKVAARDSYCSDVPASHVLTSAQRALEARAASGAAATIHAGMQLSWFYSKPNAAVVDIAMDIDPGVFKFHGLHAEFNVSGAAYRPDGSVAARVGDLAGIDFETQAQLHAFLKTAYHYSKQFDVAPGQYLYRIAFGSADQAFGSAKGTLEIDPWDGKTLSASAIALAAQDYPLTGVTSELDNSQLEGPRRLAAKGRAIIPMGGVAFRAGGNALIYLEVYDPSLSLTPATSPVAPPAIRIRILDRATAHEVDSGVVDAGPFIRPGDSVIPIAIHLPLARLPLGAYTLETHVSHFNGRDALVRRVDFDVK